MPILDSKTPATTPAAPVDCPKDYFGSPPECKCYEDNTAYFGNNEVTGSDNPQPSRVACQRSCAQHPTCQYWTWGKGEPTGPCYLKSARDNVTPGLSTYVSGTKHCKLPEAQGNYHKRADRLELREQDCMTDSLLRNILKYAARATLSLLLTVIVGTRMEPGRLKQHS